MDAEAPEFKNDYFDAVTCSFGLFFIPDMLEALTQWRRVTKKGGTVLFSSFTENAFRPLMDIFIEDLEKSGLDVAGKPIAGARLKDEAVCMQLMKVAGYSEVEQNIIQVGCHLKDSGEWWTAIWNTAMRGLVEQLTSEQLANFKKRHLGNVAKLSTEDGLWMDVEVRLTSGIAN